MQKLAEICVRRPVFATMLILALTVVGVFSFFTLGVDLFPRVDFPTITVSVLNPGASPQEIETEITDKVEASVNTISGIDELRSTSIEGVSQVFITFVLEKDADVAAQEVRDKVNLILDELPETAETPIIQKLDTEAAPVLRIVISAPRPLREVNDIADKQIGEKLESISGVGQVQIIGGSEREIQIQVDPDRMRAFNITINDVVNAVRAQNIEVPGGRIDQGTRELTVRTLGRIRDIEGFNNLAIANKNGFAVKVRDIGQAVDTAAEQRTAALFDGKPAVSILVSKQSGQNTVAVADAIRERLNEIKPTLPPDVHYEIAGDQSVYIRAAVESIETHLIEGSILASIVVFLFLWNFRSTLISAIAIPTSIISTFGLMAAMGYTLNQITMLALTLMVGIVIDDAIVVLENIYRYIEEKGLSPFQAAIEGTREIGLAVMATTLSLLAVFLPVGFMGGIVGRFMSSFGLTASFAIAVSLLVSFTLTPMLSARLIKRRDPETAAGGSEGAPERTPGPEPSAHETVAQMPPAPAHEPAHASKEGRIYRRIDRNYTRLLEWSMEHRKVIVALSALTIISIVPLFMLIGKNFLPVDDQSQFEITVRAAEGTTLPATLTIFQRIATEVRKLPGVTDTLTTVGGGQQSPVNSGSIYVKLAPIEDRELSQQELMLRARELLKKFPSELRTSVQQVAGISGGGFRNADIQYLIGGPDIQKLTQYADTLRQKMQTIPNVVDVDTSVVTGKPELRVVIDRQRAADLGVRVADIAQALNTLIAGQRVGTFNVGKDDYDVRVRAAGEFRKSVEDLKRMTVASNRGGQITLDNVVHIEPGTGPSSIDRLNRQRQVTITANVTPGGSQSEVIQRMNEFVSQMKLDPGYTTGLAGRSKELGRAGYYFVLAFALSFIFMYMVLAAQFESFIHPITILLTLPLAIPFGIISLLIFGQTVNIFSGLGLLLLFGIVKKNAILQIDHTNGLRAKGLERHAAIIQANRDRLRPILMTTIALVAGMLPLVISSGPGSGTNRSIGVLVVGGQSLCLLLTLLAVPVFYSLWEDLLELPVWRYLGHRYTRIKSGLRERAVGYLSPLINSFRRRPRQMSIIIGLIALMSAPTMTDAAPLDPRERATAQTFPAQRHKETKKVLCSLCVLCPFALEINPLTGALNARHDFALSSAPQPVEQQQQQSQQPGRREQKPPRPGEQQPSQQEQPPNSNSAPIRPRNEAQQSAQPQTGPQQQRQQTQPDTTGPRPVTPQSPTTTQPAPGSAGSRTTQPGTNQQPGATPPAGAQPGVPATPGQDVGITPGIAPAQLPPQPPVVAPDYKAPLRPLPPAERVGVDVREHTPLSLEEAVMMALNNNKDINISRIDTLLAGYDLSAARGIYDPNITSESYYEHRVTPVSSVIGGGRNGSVTQKDLTGSARLGGFTPFAGGAYQLDFSSTRLTTNNQFVSLNPQFPAALTVTYTQPLWRGLRFDDNRRRIEVAKKNLTLTDAQFRQRVIEIITRVEQAYWDLVFSLRNLDVQIEAVKQARRQSESNRRMVQEGLLAPIDIVAADTQVATFEQNVYTAQESVTRAENTLKTLLLADRTSPLWSQALWPTTPVTLEPPRLQPGEAVSSALASRPELQQLQASAEINEINSRYYRDQTRPQIDLVGTYTSSGLAGSPVDTGPNPFTQGLAGLQQRINDLSRLAGLDPLPPLSSGGGTVSDLLIGGYGQSLSNLLQQNYPTTRVGLRITLPIFNRTAEAQLGRSLTEATRIINQREQLEILIEAEVRNTIQAVRSAEAKLAAAASARSSAEQQFASEERRLQAGLSTVFLVLQRQTDLLAARGRELQAQTDLNKSIAELRRVTGVTLQSHHITLQGENPGRATGERISAALLRQLQLTSTRR